MPDHPIKSKKICFITTLPATLKAFVRPQAECLIKNGWDVTWVCAEDSTFRQELPEGVRCVQLPFKRGIDPLGVPRAIWKLYDLFKRERFDLVQYSTPNAAFYASTAAWLARVPVRLYAQWGIRYVGFHGWPRKIFKLLELWSCRLSTIIEPDGSTNLEFAVEEGLFPREKARMIWNGSSSGVNLERFDISRKVEWRERYREEIGFEPHHLVIGFVGSLRRDKGCNELIAACRTFFSSMPEVRLLLVGDKHFYHTIDRDLRDWAAASSQVAYVAPNSDIPQYLACMDVFSLPSYREGLPTVVIEAGAMGVPMVVSDVPGPIDAMRDETTGLVVPVKNVGALASALQSLLNDKVKRSTFGVAAYAFARDNFEQKELIRRVLQDKESLLAEKTCHREVKLTAKRLFDLGLVIGSLPVISPLLLVIALLLRLKQGSPVFFCQERPGLHGIPFKILKFRTMTNERNGAGDLLPDSERLTSFGRFLRSTSLDEFPALFNVLKGEMSLVGPRPLLMEYLGRYTPRQARRHEVLPGITGWAQVNGRQNLKFSKRLEYDLWYVEHQSFFLDLKILILTFYRVLQREGVNSGQDVQEVDDLGLYVIPSAKIINERREPGEDLP